MGKLTILVILGMACTLAGVERILHDVYPEEFTPLYGLRHQSSPLITPPHDLLGAPSFGTVRDTTEIDFENRSITFRVYDTLTNTPLRTVHYTELSQYLSDMMIEGIENSWNEHLSEQGVEARRRRAREEDDLTFALPTELPLWARRILGDEPPQLSISGSQSLRVGYERTVSGTVGDESNFDRSSSPVFEPTSDFRIQGSVGRLLDMEIVLRGETGSDAFSDLDDQLSEIRLHYRESYPGELEDDIIQEVELGRTNFNLPGLGLIGYPTGGEGLFGVKVKSRIGPLDLTTVLSTEQTESKSERIDLTAGSRPVIINEKDYVQNRFFFVDTLYREIYARELTDEARVNEYLQEQGLTSIPTVERLDIYKEIPLSSSDGDTRDHFIEYADPDGQLSFGRFRRLNPMDEYELDRNYNIIRFNNSLRSSSRVLMSVEFSDGHEGTGQPDTIRAEIEGEERTILTGLRVLKNPESDTYMDNEEFPLMLRNVYSIGRGDPSGFEFDIKRINDDGRSSRRNSDDDLFIDLMGLTSDGIIDRNNSTIFDHEAGFVFIPPYMSDEIDDDQRVDPLHPFTNRNLGTNRNDEPNVNDAIYDPRARNLDNRFEIHTATSERRTRFSLGFGLIEGSERIWHGADTLVPNQDYTIDAFTGEVELVSNRARSYSHVDVSYQQEALFLLDKKTLFGINGYLQFPNLGRNSYLSTSLLMLRMSSGSATPRMGTEPFNRLSYGTSLRLDFQPEWMTAAVNTIPGIDTDARSGARFDFDIARSVVTSSVDRSDGAFVDNFSTSARSFNLSSNHFSWYRSSPQYHPTPEEYFYNPPAWHFYWHRPVAGDNRTEKRDIYPSDTIRHQTEYVSTLRLTAQPFPPDLSLQEGLAQADEEVTPWAGIMRGLQGSLRDRQDDRYFEFHLGPHESSGTLYVDMGEISQDLSLDGAQPNNREDFEKFSGTLTPDDDLGLNSLPDSLEYWCYPRWDGDGFVWDTLRYGDERLGKWADDPARDNFRLYDSDNRSNRMYVNGTAGNIVVNDQPDRENFNQDGRFLVGSQSQYFRYEINLDDLENHPYTEPIRRSDGSETGWYRVRLPVSVIAEPDSIVGEPAWSDITQVRMLWKDFADSYADTAWKTLEFEGMQFVGNQWTEYLDTAFVADVDEVEVGKVIARTLDSRRTERYEERIPVDIDSTGGEAVTHYTLQVDFSSIEPAFTSDDQDFHGVERRFSQQGSLDFSPYSDIEFYLCEERLPGSLSSLEINPDNDVWFSLRLGNNDSSYYEFRTRDLPSGGEWNWEQFQVSLDALTQLKLDWFNTYGSRSGGIDTTITTDQGELRVYSTNNNYPSLSSIRWIGVGVVNQDAQEYDGVIKLTDFKSTGISNYKGVAMRSSLRLDWADFIDNTMSFDYRDATFRSMSDNVNMANNATMSSGISGEIRLDRFLGDRHGFRVPVGGSVNARLERPVQRANSDIELRQDGSYDGFRDMGRDFGAILIGRDSSEATNVTPSEEYQNISRDYTFYTGYEKNRTSDGVLGRLIADRISVSYDYSYRETINRHGRIPLNELMDYSHWGIDYFHADIYGQTRHNSALSYDMTPARPIRDRASARPFADLNISLLRGLRFNLLPEQMNLDLIDFSFTRTEDYSSLDEVEQSSYEWEPERRLRMQHGLSFNYRPIDPLTQFRYSLSVDRNFDRFFNRWDGSSFSEFWNEDVLFSRQPEWRDYHFLFSENSRRQNASMSLSPDIGRWIDLSTDITTSYSHSLDLASDSTDLDSRVSNEFRVSSGLHLRRLFRTLSDHIEGNREESQGSVAGNIADFFDLVNLSTVNLTYSASMELRNTRMTPAYFDTYLGGDYVDYFAYTLGVHGRSLRDIMTGDMDDESYFGGVRHRNDWYDGVQRNTGDRRNTTRRVEGRTSFDIPALIDLRINTLSLQWNQTYTITPELTRFDTTTTWPDFRIGASTSFLENLENIRQNFRSFRLRTGYNFNKRLRKYSTYWIDDRPGSEYLEDHTFRYGFSPLINIDATLRQPGINVKYTLNRTYDTTLTMSHTLEPDPDVPGQLQLVSEFDGGRKTISTVHSWEATYRTRGESGRSVQFFEGRPVDVVGDVTYRLNISIDKKEHRRHRADNDGNRSTEDMVEYDERTFTLRPRVEYTFTDKVDFLFSYEMQRRITGESQNVRDTDRLFAEVTVRF
ncbi:hypothetical protein [Chitinivibrio alkaliphilus]|uniref:hypothetical protein n=1 Tax=Chitinivibrio alkaliphilus TaxID=1505232 RepID=UPI0012DC4B3C|nr:hypothetical protein [Chitinivibrio alkaliphilus]